MAERIVHKTTPKETARLDRLAALAEQDRDDIVRRIALYEKASAEPGFKGDVLRAIDAATTIPLDELAAAVGIDLLTLDEFRCGERELALPEFERLARKLGFALVQTMEHAAV